MTNRARARVLILGAGFGGLYTALEAHHALGRQAEITIVDRNDYFLYTPLLYQITTGELAPRHLARPLARLLPRDVRFVQAEVHAVDLTARRVETQAGPLTFDFLVISLGGVPNFYGLASAERHALTFRTLPDALRLRSHIEQRFAEAARDPTHASDVLRTIITGAGCTGVELAAELHDWMWGPLRQQFPTVPEQTLTLVLAEALDHILCPMDPGFRRAVVRKLRERRIDVRLSAKVTEVGPDIVRVTDGEGQETVISSGTVIWTAGIKANPVVASLAATAGAAPWGRLLVTETLQVNGHPEVVAIGDAAACPDGAGGFVAATAQVAVQQGPAAARTLRALIAGAPPAPFRYKRKGEVVGLGRAGAMAEAFGFRLMGYPAWLLARTIHLARLPEWGDRMAVAWEWAKELTRR